MFECYIEIKNFQPGKYQVSQDMVLSINICKTNDNPGHNVTTGLR